MSAGWYYRDGGREAGPVSFQELMALARANKLDRREMVRREVGAWMRADSVVGLFGSDEPVLATAGVAGLAPTTAALSASPALVPQAPFSGRAARSGRERIAWSAVLVILFTTTVVGLWRHGNSRRFPEPSVAAAAPAALAVRPARPLVPSVPGLEPLTPRLVLGLERLQGAFSPCLTADLKTIVFANWKSRKTEYDLYLAARDSVGEPFDKPQLIEACVSPWTEAFPALSADGLELIYVSVDDAHPSVAPKLLRATRMNSGSPFSKPSELTLPGLDGVHQRLSSPQLIDVRRLKVNMVGPGDDRSVRVATRSGPGAAYIALDVLPMGNAWPLWWIAADALRAYGATPDGLCLCHRKSFDETFGAPEVVASSKRLGAMDGPVWLVPHEDVVFYCSGGPGKPRGESRYLWMAAF